MCKLCYAPVYYVDDRGKRKKKLCCITCYFVETVIPETEKPSVKEIIEVLKGCGFEKISKLPVNQVEEAWELHGLQREVKTACK